MCGAIRSVAIGKYAWPNRDTDGIYIRTAGHRKANEKFAVATNAAFLVHRARISRIRKFRAIVRDGLSSLLFSGFFLHAAPIVPDKFPQQLRGEEKTARPEIYALIYSTTRWS